MPKSSKEEWSPELTWTRPPLLLFHPCVITEEDNEMTLVDGDRKNQDISRMAIERTTEDVGRCGALRTICVHRPHGRGTLRQELQRAGSEEPRRVLALPTVTCEGSHREDETEDWLYASDGSQDAARKSRMYLQSETQVKEVDRLWFSTACTKCCLSSWTSRQYCAPASNANYHVVGMTGACNTAPTRVQKRSIEKYNVQVIRARVAP